jgi:DNA mismatch endonuclease (patch repair protein)
MLNAACNIVKKPYMADVHTKEQRSRNMRAIKNKNTKIETLLSKELWARGYRFRRNSKSIIGKPDISIKKYKIAVFCDSEFWHGKDWDKQIERIGTNKFFWDNKIRGNIKRDETVNEKLREQGWLVIRFWGEDIKKNLDECINKLIQEIENKKQKLAK